MKRHVRKWKSALPLICFFCLALTLSMAVYTYRYEPDRYRAAYTFYALPAGANADESALQASRMLARDCDALLNTNAFQQTVIARAKSDGHTLVTARGIDGTHMIYVEAVGISPEIVLALANASGREMLAQAETMLGASGVKEVTQAVLPLAPFAPRRAFKVALMLVCSFVSLSVLGLAFGSSREPMRWGKRGTRKAALDCLGAVAGFDREARRAQRQGSIGHCTLHHTVSRLVQENVRDVTLALRAMQEHRNCVVTTAGWGESGDGASVTLLMAAELAAQGFDVLLIEMNAAEPRLRRWLHASGRCDMLDCIRDAAALGQAILSTGIPRLCFIDVCHKPGFLPKVAATLEFSQFVSDAAHSFDYVLLNAPPLACGSDAAMLGVVSDVTLLMVEDGALTAEELESGTAELQRTVRRLGGFIMTHVPAKRFKAGGDYRRTWQQGALSA